MPNNEITLRFCFDHMSIPMTVRLRSCSWCMTNALGQSTHHGNMAGSDDFYHTPGSQEFDQAINPVFRCRDLHNKRFSADIYDLALKTLAKLIISVLCSGEAETLIKASSRNTAGCPVTS